MAQVIHGLFPERVLDNETKSRAFALVIFTILKSAAGLAESGQ
ncbi:type I restriction-modification system endonuclease [Pseudomonas alkylphenolica]|uniref:Type I restriction-modification system endonuclease n=1 Tax=Pseudomonas alkylphenolica TaxID=237609 RepID=A0A077F8R1_9PSED|nr:type I restriction-modification system endonuclease [Pseudomonas alkylphenolica]